MMAFAWPGVLTGWHRLTRTVRSSDNRAVTTNETRSSRDPGLGPTLCQLTLRRSPAGGERRGAEYGLPT